MGEVIENHPSSNNINTLYTHDTIYSADSIEWCPHIPFQTIFVCANYQLVQEENPENNTRLGRILLCSMHPETGLELLQTIDTAAVLDQKWCHNQIDGNSILAVANAKKTIEVYKLIKKANCSVELHMVTNFTLTSTETEVLILSLDWSTGKYECSTPEIVCSDSKGNIHRFTFDTNKLILDDTWHAHEFESWISAFYYWDTRITFTGGDDSVLLKFDKRVGNIPVLRNKSHQAGVTSLHSNRKKEFLIATGSYDSFLRTWDVRHMKSPTNELQLPGTLWRLKWDPFDCNSLLTACMLGGAHVVKVHDFKSMEVMGSYYEHKNIVYGADWCYLSDEHVKKYEFNGDRIIGTCSFYDHLLCVSKVNAIQYLVDSFE